MVVTNIIRNGRSSQAGMYRIDSFTNLATGFAGGKASIRVLRGGGSKRISGPSITSPLTIRAPASRSILWPSPVLVGLTPSTSANSGPM